MNKNCAEYDVVNNFQFVEKRMAKAVALTNSEISHYLLQCK